MQLYRKISIYLLSHSSFAAGLGTLMACLKRALLLKVWPWNVVEVCQRSKACKPLSFTARKNQLPLSTRPVLNSFLDKRYCT